MESVDKNVLDRLPLDKDLIDKLVQTFPPEYFKDRGFLLFASNEKAVRSYFWKPIKFHFLAAPLVDVFHVRIFNKHHVSYQIHGTIQIIDGQGCTFTLYDRVVDMPEIVCDGGTLTLTMPNDCPIIPSNVIKLKMDLKARFGNEVETITDSRTWDYTTMDDYDKVKTEIVNGVHCWADVRYITYRHANIAVVNLILFKKDGDENCNTVQVYGRIVAHFGNDYSTVLFDRKPNESALIEYETEIKLSRHALAVPVSNSLVIHAHLWNGDTKQLIIDKGQEFRVSHNGSYWKKVEEQNGLVKFQVKWSNAYLHSLPKRRVGGDSNVDNTLSVAKNTQGAHDEHTSMDLSNSNLRKSHRGVSTEVMEVFSVSVHSNSTKELNLWGSIKLRKPDRLLFDRKEASPEKLLHNQAVPMVFPEECFVDCAFNVNLDLRDLDGRVISNGEIEWNDYSFRHPIRWFGKLLCSIIPGDDGCYAAVHYVMFSAAVQATVTICLNGKSSRFKFFKIDGCVRSQYSDFKYLTIYEKEFYRRKLFVSNIEDSSWEYSDSEIMLSKSAVAVKEGSTLIVDVNLKVIPEEMDCTGNVKIDEQAAETFKQGLEFRPGMGCQRIKGECHEMVVYVKWSEVLF